MENKLNLLRLILQEGYYLCYIYHKQGISTNFLSKNKKQRKDLGNICESCSERFKDVLLVRPNPLISNEIWVVVVVVVVVVKMALTLALDISIWTSVTGQLNYTQKWFSDEDRF